jgi:hypothetical protein
VPVGVPGELFIGGVGLARGYVGRPDLTAESFVPSPFGERPGARLYRTGDVARYLEDGNIDFLGRRDGQVKIRGVRIETAEIERTLEKHPAVQRAVVVKEDGGQGPELVAYVVPAVRQLVASEIRRFLRMHLPEFMVPTRYRVIEKVPLTRSGKVDRGGLLLNQELVDDAAFVAPRTPTERALHDLWSSVVGKGRIGVDDSLFDIGGHSLTAIEIASRASEMPAARGVRVTAIDVFQFPTIATLAAHIDAQHDGADGRDRRPIGTVANHG